MANRRGWSMLAVACGVGCASPGTGSGTSVPAPPAPAAAASETSRAATRDRDVITRAELEAAGASAGDLFTAVQRLRPEYLRTRGTLSPVNRTAGRVQVSVDGAALAEVGSLRSMRSSDVMEVRYLSTPDATTRFGRSANSGPVLVVTRR